MDILLKKANIYGLKVSELLLEAVPYFDGEELNQLFEEINLYQKRERRLQEADGRWNHINDDPENNFADQDLLKQDNSMPSKKEEPAKQEQPAAAETPQAKMLQKQLIQNIQQYLAGSKDKTGKQRRPNLKTVQNFKNTVNQMIDKAVSTYKGAEQQAAAPQETPQSATEATPAAEPQQQQPAQAASDPKQDMQDRAIMMQAVNASLSRGLLGGANQKQQTAAQNIITNYWAANKGKSKSIQALAQELQKGMPQGLFQKGKSQKFINDLQQQVARYQKAGKLTTLQEQYADNIDQFINFTNNLVPYKTRLTESDTQKILREAKAGNWTPQVRLSYFYRSLSEAATKEEWPTLREAIINMQDLEKEIFDEAEIFNLREDKNQLLEDYARLVTFSGMPLRERGIMEDDIDIGESKADRRRRLDRERYKRMKAAGFRKGHGSLKDQGIRRNDDGTYEPISKEEIIQETPEEVVTSIEKQADMLEANPNIPPQEALRILGNSIKTAAAAKGKGLLGVLKKVGGKVAKVAAKVAPIVGYGISAFKFGVMFSFMGPTGLLLGAVIGVGVAKITMEVGKLGAKTGGKLGGMLYDWFSKALLNSKSKTISNIGQKLISSPKGKQFIQMVCSIIGGIAAGGITAAALHNAIQNAAQALANSFTAAIPNAEQVAVVAEQELQQTGQAAEQAIESAPPAQPMANAGNQPRTYGAGNQQQGYQQIMAGTNSSQQAVQQAQQFVDGFKNNLWSLTQNENDFIRIANNVFGKNVFRGSIPTGNAQQKADMIKLIQSVYGSNAKVSFTGQHGTLNTFLINGQAPDNVLGISGYHDNLDMFVHSLAETLRTQNGIIERAAQTAKAASAGVVS